MRLEELVFEGFRREDGQVGTRNHLGIISTVTCANQAALEIALRFGNAAVFTHQQGCGQPRSDLSIVERSLVNLGNNPNLGAVLVVSLGCEGVSAELIAEKIANSGKPVELVRIQTAGGYFEALKSAGMVAQKLSMAISSQKRQKAEIGELRIGVKCGASDPTSGLAANPAVGQAVDTLIGLGGSVVFGETTEVIGAEHILARRCANKEVAGKLLSAIQSLENRVRFCGSDIRGGNPSAGNIAAGLTTLEEKSLGAIVKSGSTTVNDVFEYGERPPLGGGLFFVDSPGREPEILAALAAAGCQVILFTTGIGAPHGFPFVPVLKICGNKITVRKLSDFIDLDVSSVISGGETLSQAGERIFEATLRVCRGAASKAEALGYVGSTGLYQTGPIV